MRRENATNDVEFAQRVVLACIAIVGMKSDPAAAIRVTFRIQRADMKTSLPGVVVILSCGIGMMCGALLDHLSVGAFVGTSVGICIGLVLLSRRKKNPGS